jgi:hypothetical protein
VGAPKGFCIHQAKGQPRQDSGRHERVSRKSGSASVATGRSLRECRTVPQIMVISAEGLFQAYNIDLENGGECSLMKEFA